jgi:hypothetical protein
MRSQLLWLYYPSRHYSLKLQVAKKSVPLVAFVVLRVVRYCAYLLGIYDFISICWGLVLKC